MSTRVLLLPQDPSHPVRCLAVEDDGHIAHALDVPPGEALSTAFASPAAHTVLVVPGVGVGTCWTDLPASNNAQARSAARLLLADRVAEPVEGLHIAIGPLHPRQPRLLCWTKPPLMQEWLARAASLGVQADVIVPAHLALPEARDSATLAEHQGTWLVRADRFAFSAEPSLAQLVLGGREVRWLAGDGVEAALAAGARQPPVNLLQYDYAPRRASQGLDPSRRRMAWLAALVLASPLLLVLADTVRYQLAARSLQARAEAVATAHLGRGTAGDAVARMAGEVVLREGPASAAALRQALFTALAATPGTRLESLESHVATGLQATLVHATPLQAEQVHATLLTHGHAATRAPLEPGSDGLRTRLQLEPAP